MDFTGRITQSSEAVMKSIALKTYAKINLTLDVTGIEAKVGDTVTIFGQEPTVNELAEILDTIPYEILTSVPRRIERIIVK